MRRIDLTRDLVPGGRTPLRRLPAAQLFVLSFVALIAVGTTGLLYLPGLYTGPGLGFVDALFTATSAVCVTGLIVVDTATYFTPWGQAWILLLIQAGGLGILTFTTLLVSALGRRRPLGLEEASAAQASLLRGVEPVRLVRTVFAVTFGLEALGTVALWGAWEGEMGPTEAVWPAVFHAVSAFCNAGFSTFSDSLVGFRESTPTVLLVSGLVIAGGLGFIVIEDLRSRWIRRATGRLTVHTRLALLATAGLLVGGTVLFGVFEWSGVLGEMAPRHRIANAWFMSVTPRTAGFNTVDYAAVSDASLFLTILFMLVGGSPGSTAGGFKTVTVALLFLLFWSRLRGGDRVSVFHRTVPQETIQRAMGLVVGGLLVLGASVFALSLTEAGHLGGADRTPFLRTVFEAHSAFGTVGLSMGGTGELTAGGRLVVTVLMLLGRVGPAAVVAAMVRAFRSGGPVFRYGEEDVALG